MARSVPAPSVKRVIWRSNRAALTQRRSASSLRPNTKDAASNDAKYDNPEFDAKLTEAAAAKTTEEANTLYQEAEAMLADELPTAPLWSAATPVAWSTKVTNVQVTPFGTLDLSAISTK